MPSAKRRQQAASPRRRKDGKSIPVTRNQLSVSHSILQKVDFVELPKGVRRNHKAIVERLVEGGVSPLEVMVDNMRFAAQQAHELTRAICERINKDVAWNQEDAIVVVDDMREMARWRDIAQTCARDAGPYIHPRLAAIELDTKSDVDKINLIKRVIVDVDGKNT